MKAIALATALLSTSILAEIQVDNNLITAQCSDKAAIEKGLYEEYNESVVMTGPGHVTNGNQERTPIKGVFYIFSSPDTSSITIAFEADFRPDYLCVVLTGTGLSRGQAL